MNIENLNTLSEEVKAVKAPKLPKVNYQIMLDKTLEGIEKSGITPRLLLHSCCAPCSTYVLEYLSRYFYITVLFFNPNINPGDEYELRLREQIRFVNEFPSNNKIELVVGSYDTSLYSNAIKGYEDLKEGSEKCNACYRFRMIEAAVYAKEHNFDFFTTTLSISPYKNAQVINQIGAELMEEYGINFLFSDFKKNNGYKRSLELCAIYSIYRQASCGCISSWNEYLAKRRERDEFVQS